MSRYDAIVIGGGLNGLVAAAVLARSGKQVCLLERSNALGGMAAPDASGQSRMAHLLYNLSPEVRGAIGMNAKDWPFKTEILPTVALAEDGNHVLIRDGDVRFADGSPHPDAAAYLALNARLIKFGSILRQLATAPPPGMTGPLSSSANLKQLMRLGRIGLDLKRMGKPELRRFLQMLLSNAYDLILDELPDGQLAGLLAADAVRGAAAGPRSPGTVFSLIYRMGHGGQAHIPVGGMAAVIDAFAQAAMAAGCEIRTDQPVARVVIEDDRVVGVETASGEMLTAPLVLSSGGALQTAQMAGTAHFDIEATTRLRNIRARGTAAKVNFTLKSAPELPAGCSQARLILAPSADYVERAFNPSKYRAMSEAPVIEAVISNGTYLSTIVQYAPVDLDGGWTQAAKDKLAQVTRDALAKSIPALPDLIATTEVITPDQIERETAAPGGHWHHAEMALDQLLGLRPANGIGRYALGPKGLYLCGASSHPGGDLMGLAGRNAALKALEDLA